MPKPSRFRGITLKLSLATCLVGPSVGAQTPSPKSGAAAGDSGDTVPRGASGALVVPPKTEAPAPAPSAPVVKPPVIKVDEGAQYPRDALKAGVRDSVTVILILEIGADGRVRKATVDGAQGDGASASLFEAAALEAAQKIQAEPATKNGVPVVSRVKHRYDFKPPPGRLVGRVVDQKTGVGIANVAVRVMLQDGTEQVLTTDEKGQWRSEAVPMGACKVTVTMAGYDEQTVDESVNPGEEANLSVRLAPSASAVSDGSKKGPVEVVEEVTVQGKRPPREITRRTLEQRELTRIPGTNGDALRALQNLPGVARPPGLAGLLIVRGSSPQSTNVFVDGTLIPLVYHFGGLSSVLPTEMLERIDFFPGNFSAQYGRVTGGVVDVAVRDPRNDGKHHGLVQADLIDTRILAEGPIGNTGWKYNVSGRRSWIDTWLKPALTATGAGVTTAPVYYDYQIGAQRDLPKNGNIRFLFFGSDDRLELLIKQANAQGLGGNVGLHTGFWRFQSRFRQKMGNDTEFRAVGAVGQDVIEFNFGDNKLNISSVPVTARVELAQKLAPGVTANVGMDWLWSPYDVNIRLPPPPRPGEPPPGPGLSRPPLEVSERGTQYRPALYTEFELTPAQGTRIVPGVRLDYARDTKSWDLGPRVVARQDITRAPRTTLKGGAGMFFQPPQPQETNPVFGMPSSKSARAIHYGFGVERELTDHIDLSMEAFYKQLDRFFTNGQGDVAKGRAYGLETLLRYKPDSRFFGWLAYTLSRSVLRDTPDEPEHPAQFDQTHILTVLGSYRLGRGWEVGSRFRLVSGNPTTPNSYGFFDENASTYLPLQSYPPFGKRLPAFHQLDVRIDKTWAFPTWKLSAYLDVQNVYNQGNVEGVSYNYNFTKSSYATGIPILPSIGIRGEL